MPSKYVHTEVEGRKLKLSNLDKVLYPNASVSKAEVIQYMLDVAPLLLKYIKGRPLTLIRFPDGIGKKQFYSKSKPDWTPEWIDSIGIAHSEETIRYIIANEPASVVWLANLAALEIHPMQMTKHEMDTPDHFIFDLDPPDNGDFDIVKTIALKLHDFLISYGYAPFVKTSGSKGLHIYVPITKTVSHEKMTDAVKKLAKVFVSQNSDTSTLAMNKEKREGKTLIDIFRNHKAHTTVAPYSLRGKSGAPISFPISWDQVPSLSSSKDIHINNYRQYLDSHGDVWSSFYDSAVILHTERATSEEIDSKVSEKLKEYIEKRNFELTPEPGLESVNTSGKAFCIQLHNARNLHYDLRLEKDGVLLSWAIPKGLPLKKGIKRLAIRTEDHPMKYLTFEGSIPKGEYGAGEMWVYTKGDFEWLEQAPNKYKIKLNSDQFNRSFNLFKTKDQHWMIELISNDDFSEIEMPLKPMLAGVSEKVPTGNQYLYEIKWDGIRAIFHLENEEVKIYSRSGRDISQKFPELLDHEMFDVEQGIFDGEIVHLDEKGRPLFSQIISRMHTTGDLNINKAAQKIPAVGYLFDCIMLDGKYIHKETLVRRQAWLNVAIKNGKALRISEAIEDGQSLFDATKKMELEGIMAKLKDGVYNIGQRTDEWLKVKHRKVENCFIAGYTKGQGDRSNLFGALHLLRLNNQGQLQYMGKVGTGFDTSKMKQLLKQFKPLEQIAKPFDQDTDDDRNSVWLEPILKCEIKYASLASSGVYREPVFIKLLKD